MNQLDLQSPRMEIKLSVKHHYKQERVYSVVFSHLAPKYPAWSNAIISLEDIFKGLGSGTGKWGQHSGSGLKCFFCCTVLGMRPKALAPGCSCQRGISAWWWYFIAWISGQKEVGADILGSADFGYKLTGPPEAQCSWESWTQVAREHQ